MERKSAELFSNCPWEENTTSAKMVPLGDELIDIESMPSVQAFLDEQKAEQHLVPQVTKEASSTAPVTVFEQTREGMPKAYIPNWYYKPPFGYPRYKDLAYYRELANSIYVDMCETAIIDEVCSVQWEIVAEDRAGNEVPGKDKEVETVRSFFENPNTNPESWETIVRMMLPDLLELNSGIMVKVFNAFGKMVEVVARDGIAFTKNPDVYGMFTNRADLILVNNIMGDRSSGVESGGVGPNYSTYPLYEGITTGVAREEGAYFQYGWNSASKPVPYGKREIVWFEKKVRTDDLYGRSAMEVLAKTVQTLIYAVEHNLEYFSDNSIPPGVLGLEGMKTGDMKAFAQQWNQSQQKQDSLGNWKKAFHKLAMVNKKPTFERLGFTNQELELIESQKWWSKMVWASFGITATELGFTEDSKGSANQIVQTSVAKKRIIYPILRLIEYYVNTQIVSEFGYEGVRYKYKIFDVDEEKKKYELYKIQTESDIKTINEVRNAEGLDPVEWGDKNSGERSSQPVNNMNLTDPNQTAANAINSDAQNARDDMTGNPKKKASETGSPTVLRPNEQISGRKLSGSIINTILDENKKKLFEILEEQKKPDPLTRIKSVDDIPKIIDNLFGAASVKAISDAVIKAEFDKGWEASEKQLDMNVQYNEKALEFLQDYTFDNIKNLAEETANDLKAELSRGIINGEGIAKLKKRVEGVVNKSEHRAETIARTETATAENQGKLLAMKGSKLDIKKYIVIKDDNRTSDVSFAMESKYGKPSQAIGINDTFSVTVKGKEYSGQVPPFMPNDRDAPVFILPDEDE